MVEMLAQRRLRPRRIAGRERQHDFRMLCDAGAEPSSRKAGLTR